MPRVLEDMFWFGRYAERAEDLLRLVLTAHAYAEHFRLAGRAPAAARASRSLIGRLARLCGSPLAPDHSTRTSARCCSTPIARARWRTRSSALRDALAGVRDQLSPDTWRAFGIDRPRVGGAARAITTATRSPSRAGRMLTGILSLQGVTANMIRDPGWHMIERRPRTVERGLQLCHLLRRDDDRSGAASTSTATVLTARADGRRELGHPPPPLPRHTYAPPASSSCC